ncbi:secretion system protein E [Candidatus Woesearchaeota archaeon]|nr:secretion system protein E [Candidatus Woesearchaeota archaeon]
MALIGKKDIDRTKAEPEPTKDKVTRSAAPLASSPFGAPSGPAEYPREIGTARVPEAAAKPAENKEKPSFYIDLRPRVITLPEVEDKTKINIRYPLIPPFAFAHIFWDSKNKEVVYLVEEPSLDDTEKEILRLVQLGLEEMINISFVRAAKMNIILEYLEKNVQSILIELGTKVSKETYQKLMYYVYRNSVGFNEIEAMLQDYYIEDIECNGVGFPVYIVHRKFQNLRTNIIYNEASELSNFVEKLAQKAGRYVSYAKPLLDGTLPDGSRVNATFTEDVTTRGPTFTIRKFTKEPWTPIHLIGFKTGSPELFAYFWLAIENKFNILVIGETASGKTTFLNSIATFIPPEARVVSIEDTRELNLTHINWLPAVTRSGFGIPGLLGKSYGEITLYDLLRETFRQNPDYVIVGETRGKEAYVMFQGMASGHPSFSTFHAANVETVIRRLETPPINLPASLIESLDIVVSVTHIKTLEKNIRRMKECREIVSVSQQIGKVDARMVFEWDASKDSIVFNANSLIMEKITKRTGMRPEHVNTELRRRTEILKKMSDKGITGFKQFNSIINQYYKDPTSVLKRFGIR